MVASEILHSPTTETKMCYDEIRPVPRVKQEASENYVKNRGTVQLFVFSNQQPPKEKVFSYDEIKPVPRVKSEANGNFIKNKGSIQDCVFKENEKYCDVPTKSKHNIPKPRCPTRASLENYELNRNGTIRKELFGDEPARPQTAPSPRVKPEAQKIARLSSGCQMKAIVNEFGQYRPAQGTPRVKSEGKNISVLHSGGRMGTIINKYGTGNDHNAVPRVKTGGKDYADMGQGGRMRDILSQKRKEDNAKTTPRVKKEAANNAYKGKGVRMQKILLSVESDSPKPVRRVKPEAATVADMDRGTRMSHIVHDASKLPETPKLSRGVRSPDAKKIQEYGRGHVGQITQPTERTSIVFKPGLQSPHYDIAPVS